MPKPPKRRNTDYLQFRPYHAFTASQQKAGGKQAWKIVWRALLVVGILGMLALGAWLIWH